MGDPVTAFIAKVIVAIVTPTGSVAAISTTFAVVSKIAATVAAMAAASAYAKGQMPKLGDSADLKRDVNIRGGTEARTIVYGEALVGGVIAYSNVGGPDKRELTTVIVHAGHEVHDMTDVFLDASRITNAQIGSGAGAGTGFHQVTSGDYFVGAPTNTGYAGVDRRKGSPTQSSNALLIAQFGTDFDTADRGRNVAYSVFQLALVEPSQKMFEGGVRDYKTLIQGKLVYNPAADTSAGADMIANGFASTTYKSYSTNPILCAIDYLMDDRLGMAVKPSNINWDEVVAEAAYCDRPVATSVTGERDTRFSCNGALSTYDTYKTNISRIISSCNGSIAYKNGKWFLKAGRYGQGYSGVANGAFSSNASWAKFGTGTAAETGGRMECISTSGNKVGRYQQLNGLVVGARYVVTGLFEDAVIGAASKAEMNITTGAGDTGTVVGGASIATTGGTPNILDGNQEFEFIATATTLFLNVLAIGTSTVYFDNIEAYVVAEVTLNEDWLRDSVGIQTGLTKQERFNGTRAFYFSAAESFKQIQSLEVTNTINLARDNQESLFRELSLPMTNSEDRAQRIQYKLLKMNERQVRISVACNYLALNVAVHDRLMVTIGELGFNQKPFLVETWELMDSQGGVNMTLIEDDADYWRDPDTNDYSTRTDTGVVIPATPEVPPPTNVTLTARVGLPDLTISWTDPEPSQQYDYAQVYRATSNNFGAAVVLVDLRGNTYTDTQAAAGQNYYYWVRSRKGREFSTEVATTPTNATGAAINAATATNVEWSGVLNTAGTIPANNATVGATWGSDILNEPTSLDGIDSTATFENLYRRDNVVFREIITYGTGLPANPAQHPNNSLYFRTGVGYYISSNPYPNAGPSGWIYAGALGGWDGSTVATGTITTLGSTTINATTINADSLDVNGAGDVTQAGTGVTFKAGASNASYASELSQFVATRAATTAYKFLATRSSGGSDVEHNLRGNGDGLCDGAWTGGGADFAEFMEWADENPTDEDRTGMTVAVAVQDTTGHITPKIKIAEAGDVVIGAVSAAPTLVGNSDWNRWQGKWLKTKYGAYDLDAEGNRQLNPAWNGSTYEEHIPRDERKEWAKIGIVGFVIIDDGQVTGNNWINFGSLGQGVSRWLLK